MGRPPKAKNRIKKILRSNFTPENLEAIAQDLKSGRLPLKATTISDDMQVGLRAKIRNTGLISYHVHYEVDGAGDDETKRPFPKIGSHAPGQKDHLSLAEARQLAKVIIGLGQRGINPFAAAEERIIRELREKGDKWKP